MGSRRATSPDTATSGPLNTVKGASRIGVERVATILTTPGAFEAHGIWFPERELEVV